MMKDSVEDDCRDIMTARLSFELLVIAVLLGATTSSLEGPLDLLFVVALSKLLLLLDLFSEAVRASLISSLFLLLMRLDYALA